MVMFALAPITYVEIYIGLSQCTVKFYCTVNIEIVASPQMQASPNYAKNEGICLIVANELVLNV